MISAYFGLPRCGKTTFLVSLALKESRRIDKHRSRYDCIISNVPLERIPHTLYCDFTDLGDFDLPHNALYLIDEASVHLDSRAYKTIKQSFLNWLAYHGHYADCHKRSNDVIFFLQTINGYDKRARSLTENLYYVRKIGQFSLAYKIPYGVVFPDGEALGEISEGYRKPSFFQMLTGQWLYRRPCYKYFDSYSKPLPLKPYALSRTFALNAEKPPRKP